eukprot:365988-Chlamydomonas_euryale.AAC.9
MSVRMQGPPKGERGSWIHACILSRGKRVFAAAASRTLPGQFLQSQLAPHLQVPVLPPVAAAEHS